MGLFGNPPSGGQQPLGPQGGPPRPGPGAQDIPDECWYAISTITITVSVSGGPEHQIKYCWDSEAGDDMFHDGHYDPNGWNNGAYQTRWTEPDDLYQGKFYSTRINYLWN